MQVTENTTPTENIQIKMDQKLIPLIPTKNAKNGEIYSKHLTDALNNDDIFNIALTGGYGSGKTSVIETFLNSYSKYNKKVIRISLAAFNFVKNDEYNDSKTKTKPWTRVVGVNGDESNEQIQLEISLLQQFLFQSKSWERRSNNNLLNRFSINTKIGISILLIVLSSVSLQILWNPYLFNKWFPIYTVDYISHAVWINLLSLFCILLTFSWISYNSFWIIKNFKTAKIDLTPIVLEVASTNEKISILNNYLFEIVKFFRDEKVNIVILEDIDRLETHDLFEKLREINNILKFNPETQDLKVKFIYSIKESVFKNEKEKNKFFDLIIPVVPYVNNQNSKDKLRDYIMKVEPNMNSKLNEVIQIASLCIDDMRTIANISNEYNIYKSVTRTGDLDPEKLLAIIIYKNIFPSDFEKIHVGNSLLQKIFNRTDELRDKKKTDLTLKLENIKKDIKDSQIEEKKNLIELREQYLMGFIKKLDFDETFELNGNNFTYNQLVQEDIFLEIIKNGISTNLGDHYSFSEIEKEVNENSTYERRVKLVESKNQQALKVLETTKNQIQSQIARIESFPFSKLIDGEEFISEKDLGCETEKNSSDQFRIRFVETMLLKGYITPDYKYWISIFHEGSLSNADRNFIFSIKNNRNLPFDTKIDHPDVIVLELMPEDWASTSILNFDFFNYVLKHNEYKYNVIPVYDNMNRNDELSLKFIFEFFETTSLKKTFITQVIKFWPSFTDVAISKNQEISNLLPYMLFYGNEETLLNQNINEQLTFKINEQSNLIELLSTFKYKKEAFLDLKKNLNSLDIKLDMLQTENQNPILDVIYDFGFYKLNLQNVEKVVQIYSGETTFTYSSIISSSLTSLKEYISKNLNEFIVDVLFPARYKSEYWLESRDVIIDLLNNTELIQQNKEVIIRDFEFEKLDFKDIDSTPLWAVLIESKRINGSWENFQVYVEKIGKIDDNFLKMIQNDEWLSELNTLVGSSIKQNIIKPILIQLMAYDIDSKALSKLLRKYRYYLSADFITEEALSDNLVVVINIDYFQYDLEIYNSLKIHPSTQNVHLIYLLKFQDSFMENMDETFFVFDKSEMIYILTEPGFNNDIIRAVLLNNIETIQTFSHSEAKTLKLNIEKIGDFSIVNLMVESLKILSENDQVSLFNQIYASQSLGINSIKELLVLMKGSLSNITKSRWPIKIEDNQNNQKFVKIMVELGIIKPDKYTIKDNRIKFTTKNWNL